MLDELDPAVRYAIMSVLSAVYESGIVEEVDLVDVLRLFGFDPADGPVTKFSFRDEGWIEAYIDFREEVSPIAGVEFEFDPNSETAEEDIEAIMDLADWSPDGKSN